MSQLERVILWTLFITQVVLPAIARALAEYLK